MNSILLVEDDQSLNTILSHYFKKNNYNVLSYTDATIAEKDLDHLLFDIALLDVNLGNKNGFQLLKKIKNRDAKKVVTMITAFGNITDAKKAIKEGAYDYLTKPITEKELLKNVSDAFAASKILKTNIVTPNKKHTELIGESQEIKKIKTTINNLHDKDISVFISGETGTGKEVIAKMIHYNSMRKNAPFIAINGAAISENIFESELFGHVKGSFTGAIKEKKGKFELANGGTIFLDEITEMPLPLQAKLLRVIQERVIDPVGSENNKTVDVRIISATNKDIEKEVKEGRFREDLFYRLNIFPINIPPLRKHSEDIPLLLEYFSKNILMSDVHFSDEALEILQKYSWPGNVRELQNFIQFVTASTTDKIIEAKHLSDKISNNYINRLTTTDLRDNKSLAEYEKEIIVNLLKKNDGNQTQTAIDLDVTRAVLMYKIKKLKITSN